MATAILMYHAVSPGRDRAREADPHYTVSRDVFATHLRTLLPLGPVESLASRLHAPAGDRRATVLTFDDGHESNYSQAFPLLLELRCSADFFVNPARVGTRGHASWPQLREMADAGMSIQSHGWDHTHFDALSPDALEQDLRRSKAEIEDRLGHLVTLLAPPGGRTPPMLAHLACALGYRAVACSVPGLWCGGDSVMLPRFAVRSTTSAALVEAWARGDAAAVLRERTRHAVLHAAKRLLGSGGYERLRARVLQPGLAHGVGERPA
jgi:peptidoglycan/xylan/chitin deacetylase (PgdA/CDA1 family)